MKNNRVGTFWELSDRTTVRDVFFLCDLCCQQHLVSLSDSLSLPPTVFGCSFLAACVLNKPQTALILSQGQWLRGRQGRRKLPCSQVTVVWKPTWDHWVNKWFLVRGWLRAADTRACVCTAMYVCVHVPRSLKSLDGPIIACRLLELF